MSGNAKRVAASVKSMTPKSTTPENQRLSKQRLRLWLKMLKASSRIEDELRRRLKTECTSTLPRFDVMSALAREPDGLKMSEISKRLRVSNGNITLIVDKLTQEGLALRVAVPGDRRAHRVTLTATGREIFAEHAAVHETWVNELLAGLGDDEIDGLMHQLDHLTQALEE